MKICSRIAKTCFGDTDLIQIKVWVDQMEKQNGEKIAFPCHESYTKFAVNDDTLTTIWAQFVEEFGYFGEGCLEPPFDLDSFITAVKKSMKNGSVGMSCDKDVDNPDHWVEIGDDARSPDDDTPSPRIHDVEAYKTFMNKAEVFEYICDGCALGTIINTTIDQIRCDFLNDVGDGDGKVYIVHEDHFKLPSPFVDDLICTFENKDKSDVKLILKYSDLDDEGVKEIQGREIDIYRVTGTRDFVIRVLK